MSSPKYLCSRYLPWLTVAAASIAVVAFAAGAKLPTISPARLLEHIKVLSSDEFEGRLPATVGETKSVEYITQQFKALGLQPGNPDGTYVQKVPLVGISGTPTLSFNIAGKDLPMSFRNDYVATTSRAVPEVSLKDSQLVFVGYGVQAPEYDWDDYKGLDVRGKTLVMLINDPAVPDPKQPDQLDASVFKGKAMTYYGRWTYKYEIGAKLGADGVLIVHETGPAGYGWNVVEHSWTGEAFELADANRSAEGLPVQGWITLDKAKQLFGQAGLNFEQLKAAAIKRDFKPVALNAKLSATIRNQVRQVESQNVLARLPGSDPQRANEYVIYTAHWDHLGKDMSLQGDQIHNGAVDNASGVAGLLEIARAFSTTHPKPARSILFISVTAEEQGLLGSLYYAQHPLYPLQKTLADLNMDSLNVWGRTRDVQVVGFGQNTLEDVLAKVVDEQRRMIVADTEPEKGRYFRSDQFSFAKLGVPGLYVKGGVDTLGKPAGFGQTKLDEYTAHDYHAPSDEIHKDWDLRGAAEDMQMLYAVGREVADAKTWPTWKPDSEFKQIRETSLSGASSNASTPAWPQFVEQFEQEYFRYEPAYAVVEGRHEFDGQLPDWSANGIQREIDWLSAQRKQAASYAESDLTPAQRFERDYVLAVIDGNLFWLKEAEWPLRNPAYYLGSLDPDVYLSRPYAPPAERMKAFIAYAKRVPQAVQQIDANLRKPLPASYVEYAVNAFGGFAAFYREDVPKAFAEVADPDLQRELKNAIEPAAQAMQSLADNLKTQGDPKAEFALGAERFAHMLSANELVTTPLAQLRAIGEADLRRNLEALKQACAQFTPRADTKQCIAKVNSHKPEGGAVAWGTQQLQVLRQFVAAHRLVTIPGEEMAKVAAAPAYNRQNLAYISVPGPYDMGMPSTYYIAPPDPSWSKADQAAYVPSRAFLEYVSVHEVWPGHFLQFLHANRSASRFGQLFVGYAYAEGWAHYAEEMMWDAGLNAGDAEMHIGQLMNALMRDVRFLCAIGLHTENMSVERCEQMFREQALLDRGNAHQQALRGTYDPAYLNYTMGKLMIKKLREDWTASRGGKEAWRAFHDQFLSYGGPPIPLVREQMLGKKDAAL